MPSLNRGLIIEHGLDSTQYRPSLPARLTARLTARSWDAIDIAAGASAATARTLEFRRAVHDGGASD